LRQVRVMGELPGTGSDKAKARGISKHHSTSAIHHGKSFLQKNVPNAPFK
jgi:hypothetical protein